MKSLDQFQKQKYLNLETFRKNGESMKTPVWFVQDGETIYVQTVANSGKVKRIRNNGRVNIAPCKMDGTPAGTWVPANARRDHRSGDLHKSEPPAGQEIRPDEKDVCDSGAARQGRQEYHIGNQNY